MNALNNTITILDSILVEKHGFYKSLRRCFDKVECSNEDKKNITAFVGCILRHYLSYTDLLKRKYPNFDDHTIYVIMFMLSNVIFLKRFEEDVWVSAIHEYIKTNQLNISADEIVEFVKSKTDGTSLIDESIDKGSFLFCSLRFNIPLYLTKMWTRSYGKNLTYKLAKGNTKSPKQIVRLNELKMSKEEFEKKFSKDFIRTEYDGLYEYIGKNPLKRLPLYQNKKIFAISIGLHRLVNDLDLDILKPIAVYSGFYNPLFLDLNVSYNNKIIIENLVEPKKDYHLFKNEMKQFDLGNNSIIECEPSSFIASLSKNVDTFILYPSNSSFEQLRLTPDHFLYFDPSTLDSLIEKQKQLLNEAKNFVVSGGRIVYVVNTLCKKESEQVIQAFLNENKNFSLVIEKQYFPFESEDTTLYYAILKKGNND